MYTKVLFDDDARDPILYGIEIAERAAGSTLGPRGRNVAYDKGYGGPEISNDGEDVLDQIKLQDPNHQKGLEIAKDAASKTNAEAGDGTSTTTKILGSMAREGTFYLKSGMNVIGLKEGIKRASDLVIEKLERMARPVTSKEDLVHVATISSESEEMGKIIAEIIEEIGPEGTVRVEESKTVGFTKEKVEGLEVEKGYASPYMVTDTDLMEAVAERAAVIITDKKLTSPREVLPIISELIGLGKKELLQIFIIAEDFSEEFLSFVVANKMRNGPFRIIGIKTPGFGDRKKDYLEDIAVITGTKVLSDQVGTDISRMKIADLGRAEKVEVKQSRTQIIGGGGSKEDIASHIERLKRQRDEITSEYDKKKIEDRIARVSGGICVLRIGAATEGEISYIKPKIEDSINATKAAKEQGIVPGGGVALVKIAQQIRSERTKDGYTEGFGTLEDRAAMEIVLGAIESPFIQILLNAGISGKRTLWNGRSPIDKIIRKVRDPIMPNGYDSLNMSFISDMYNRGIVDPLKVTKAAVKNAASGAATFLTIGCAISQIKEPNDNLNE